MLSTGEYTLEKQSQDGVQIVRKINKENARVLFNYYIPRHFRFSLFKRKAEQKK
jgi:hypothetical protein